MFKILKKADIVLFIILVAAGLGLSAWSASAGGAGQKAVVTVDGRLYGKMCIRDRLSTCP